MKLENTGFRFSQNVTTSKSRQKRKGSRETKTRLDKKLKLNTLTTKTLELRPGIL